MSQLRIVIADDSSMARSLIRTLLEQESDIQVVGEACNGRQAVEMAKALRPDLLTMDLEMPVMNGLEAIDEIMCSKALPILVVSDHAHARQALEAIEHGALDVISKPDYSDSSVQAFIAKLRMLAGVSVITRFRSRSQQRPAPMPHIAMPSPMQIVAIASSTGGPQALAQLLPQLPASFPSPVVIAQHIAAGFAGGMCDWLATLCKLPVTLAREGELLKGGTIYIAPSEHHLQITPSRHLRLIQPADTDLYHPDCNCLLNSVAEIYGRHAIGVIMTGMGHDGAAGMAAIRQRGGMTIAQDESTSLIYGMNRVAVEQQAIQQILPLSAIAAALIAAVHLPPAL
jgi:two-component system, chemotaxis family, protein-glutamate methylesterase/glutaminase